MASTYELIASSSPTGGTTVTFNSISQAYTDLKIIICGKSNQTGTSYNSMRMTINNDTTTNYWQQSLDSNSGGTAAYTYYAYQYLSVCDMAQASQSVAGFSEIDINDYTNGNKYKTVLMRLGTDQNLSLATGCLPSNTAITRLDFTRDGSNTFRTGTTIKIYGIKRA